MVDFETDPEVFFAEFGETVTYRPLGGAARSIKAIVEREPAATEDRVAAPMIRVTVANRSTAIGDDEVGGIGSDEVNAGGDKLTLARRVGETVEELTITEVTMHDDEMMDLAVG